MTPDDAFWAGDVDVSCTAKAVCMARCAVTPAGPVRWMVPDRGTAAWMAEANATVAAMILATAATACREAAATSARMLAATPRGRRVRTFVRGLGNATADRIAATSRVDVATVATVLAALRDAGEVRSYTHPMFGVEWTAPDGWGERCTVMAGYLLMGLRDVPRPDSDARFAAAIVVSMDADGLIDPNRGSYAALLRATGLTEREVERATEDIVDAAERVAADRKERGDR